MILTERDLMKKYNAGLPSVGFNKSEVLPIRLKPSFTILIETVLLYSLKLPILFSTIEFHNIPCLLYTSTSLLYRKLPPLPHQASQNRNA